MFFSKSVQLFCVSILSLTLYTQARSMNDVKIFKTADKWQCDRIQCPLNAHRCIVSKSNEENPSVLKRVNICYSGNNKILAQRTFTSPADPNTVIRQKMTSTRNRATSSTSSFNASGMDFDEKKFNNGLHRKLQKMNQNINSNVQGQMSNMKANMNRMKYRLAHMFD